MRVIPVIDLLNGLVVRGIGGRRHEYRPVISKIARDPQPETVANAFRNLGFNEAYVADLDAIQGKQPSLPIYNRLVECGLTLWIDAGINSAPAAMQLAGIPQWPSQKHRMIVGSESLAAIDQLEAILETVGVDRIIFSLDLKDGNPLTSVSKWRTCSPQQIAEAVIEIGLRRLIVLDLAYVGLGSGTPTVELCRRLRDRYSDIELVSGGGVRDQDDLRILAEAGCDAALVASALHDGQLP